MRLCGLLTGVFLNPRGKARLSEKKSRFSASNVPSFSTDVRQAAREPRLRLTILRRKPHLFDVTRIRKLGDDNQQRCTACSYLGYSEPNKRIRSRVGRTMNAPHKDDVLGWQTLRSFEPCNQIRTPVVTFCGPKAEGFPTKP
jgi:hypothetical protein